MINWKLVNKHLICPVCGDKSYLVPETDGYEGSHTHFFQISRSEAQRISDKHSTPLEKVINLLPLATDKQLKEILKIL